MKKTTKRWFSVFLSFLTVLSIVAINSQFLKASALTLTRSGYVCYDQGITFTFDKFNNCYSYRITILYDGGYLEESWIPSSYSTQTSHTVYSLPEKINYKGASLYWDATVIITGWSSSGGLVNKYQFTVNLGSCGYAVGSSLAGYKDHAVNYCVDGRVLWTQEYTGRNVCSGYNTVIYDKPTKTGYTFLGWSKQYNASSASYVSGDSIYHNHEDITLYAVWSANTYTIQYDANGGYGAPASQTKTYDQALTLRTEQPYRSGYSFLGWSTNSSATNAEYAPGGLFTTNTNTTLYAVWSDSEEPTCSISSTNNVAASQTATLSLSDNDRIAGYYWGTSSYYAGNTYTATSSTSVTKTVSSAGTYYLTAMDTSGNLSNTTSITYYSTTLNANGGSVSPSSVLTQSGKVFTLPTPTRSGYTFSNWNTSSGGAGASYTGSYTVSGSKTLYAQWSYVDSTKPTGSISSTNNVAASQTVTLSLSDNVGIAGYYWGTSSSYANNTYTATSSTSVTKTVSSAGTYYLTVKDTSGNLSNTTSITYYSTTLNANGGSVSPSSVLTQSGKSFTLPTPTRSGYTFSNWNTSSGGAGTSYTGSYTVSGSKTLYAVWQSVNVYNLGEETYSFSNYTSCTCKNNGYGHCFGMSITSAGYYTSNLNTSLIGINSAQELYSVRLSGKNVKATICKYQNMQGSCREGSTVAGGSWYLNNKKSDIESDWRSVVNYVKNHAYDGKGSLQIGFRNDSKGGHAINFLRYEEVSGQPRIYAYDNNYPTTETYFYRASNGNVYQAPQATFKDAPIDCIALRDVSKYYRLAVSYDATHVIYANRDEIAIEGAVSSIMDGDYGDAEREMFEIPAKETEVTITPLVGHAKFTYLDQTYSFGNVNADTYGTLKLAKMQGEEISGTPDFRITGGDTKITIHNYTPSRTIDYRTTITFSAEVTDKVSGAQVHWFVDGKDLGVNDTCTVKDAKADFTVQAKYIKDGKVLAESEIETVKVNSGFFARLIAFFRGLFGLLPKVAQDYLGVEFIDKNLP